MVTQVVTMSHSLDKTYLGKQPETLHYEHDHRQSFSMIFL